MSGPNDFDRLPRVVPVPDQPCQQLFEGNPVLLGYDVVQYHFIPSVKEGGQAVLGKPENAFNFNGYQFWFSTGENRQLFIDDPWRYAPAWGGFCSWGIGLELPPEWPWDIDYLGPPASPWNGWMVVDGVLMFNIWESYSDLFSQNIERNMELAAQRWADWFGEGKTRYAGPFNTHCIGHGRLKNWCLSRQPSPWMEELPSCDPIAVETVPIIQSNLAANSTSTKGIFFDSPSTNASSTSSFASSGGIVSDLDEYEHFTNAKYSPHQQRMWKIGASLIFVFLLIFVVACCYRKKLRIACANLFTCDKKSATMEESGDKNVASSSSTTSKASGEENKQEQVPQV